MSGNGYRHCIGLYISDGQPQPGIRMGRFQTPCILVVTDEPLIRHTVARLLASEGLWAVTAEHGEADFEEFARVPVALILVNSYCPTSAAAKR